MEESKVPEDVQFVWALEYLGIPVGRETFQKCLDISNKYPEYFDEKHQESLQKYKEEQRKLREWQGNRGRQMLDELCEFFKRIENDRQ